MSAVVFAIAAIPAACVFWVGCSTYSPTKLYAAAALASGLGLLTGNPIYAALDIFVVLTGLFFGRETQKSRIRSKLQEGFGPFSLYYAGMGFGERVYLPIFFSIYLITFLQ